MKIPKAIQNLIESFEKLPGIGPKSASRLTYYLLHVPQSELDKFSMAISNLKKQTTLCTVCFTMAESSPCDICEDQRRDRSIVCVVEQPLDVLAIERSGKYNGLYHVLHGKIDPLNNIGPDEIYIKQLFERISANQRNGSAPIREIILATNPTMEGESTAMYISKQLKAQSPASPTGGPNLKITRIGRGLPTGADLEYADHLTLERAMEGRSDY